MQKSCLQCQTAFERTNDDLAFYDKISPIFKGKKYAVPAPTLCPDCRQQRRLGFRNERKLYHRKCDLSGKQIITMYSQDKPYKVYDQKEWWSDKWDGLSYGQEFNFNKSFFEQFKELFLKVPHISLINKEHENSEYCNFALRNKNSYLLFTSAECEDSYYSNRAWKSKNISDCSNVLQCELGYELIDSNNCYHCSWLQNCSNCSDCLWGYNLKNCRHCFNCCNLNNASYCIDNKPVSKEAYEIHLKNQQKNKSLQQESHFELQKKAIRKYIDGVSLENCTGNALYKSKNAQFCFEATSLQDCKFVFDATFMKDSYDVNNDDFSELVYEAVGSDSNYRHLFNDICWFNREILYCSLCFNSQNLFGCTGMKNKKYCILNKQYSKEEYEILVPRITEHMQKNSEWGEFFPLTVSPFGYNETVAEEHFSMDKLAILSKGWKWHEEEAILKKYLGPDVKIPDDILDVDESICDKILLCEATGKPYKIIPQELAFYKKMGLPIPRKCPDQRHKERLAMRNPRRLFERTCGKCAKLIKTTYAPERPEVVYCEECYLQEVY